MTGIPHHLFSADFSREMWWHHHAMVLLLRVKGREIRNENGGIEPSVIPTNALILTFWRSVLPFVLLQCSVRVSAKIYWFLFSLQKFSPISPEMAWIKVQSKYCNYSTFSVFFSKRSFALWQQCNLTFGEREQIGLIVVKKQKKQNNKNNSKINNPFTIRRYIPCPLKLSEVKLLLNNCLLYVYMFPRTLKFWDEGHFWAVYRQQGVPPSFAQVRLLRWPVRGEKLLSDGDRDGDKR